MNQIDNLVRQLTEPVTPENEDTFEQVAIQLGKIGDDALPAIATLLVHENIDVRFWGVRSLWANGSDAARRQLIQCLSDPEEMVRSGAALTLGELKATSSISALVALLTKDSGASGDHAADALGKIGPAASQALIAALADKRAYVRIRAAKALVPIESHAAIPALIHCWENDESYLVRHHAEIALKRMGVGEMVYFR